MERWGAWRRRCICRRSRAAPPVTWSPIQTNAAFRVERLIPEVDTGVQAYQRVSAECLATTGLYGVICVQEFAWNRTVSRTPRGHGSGSCSLTNARAPPRTRHKPKRLVTPSAHYEPIPQIRRATKKRSNHGTNRPCTRLRVRTRDRGRHSTRYCRESNCEPRTL
jgi:hypothetical protein